MIIGIPKEIMHDEARVSATPETVKKMVADGNVVLVENGGSGLEAAGGVINTVLQAAVSK